MRRRFLCTTTLLLVLTLAMFSCEKQTGATADTFTATISIPNFESSGGAATLSITTNENWTIQTSAGGEWLVPSATSGSGNSNVTLTAQRNPSFTDNRTTELTISTVSNKSKKITITQSAAQEEVPAGNIEFSDPVFKAMLLNENPIGDIIPMPATRGDGGKEEEEIAQTHVPAKIDANGDGEISYEEAYAVEQIIALSIPIYDGPLQSMDEVKYFSNLENLFILGGMVEELDVTENRELKFLAVENTPLAAIDLSQNSKIEVLFISKNPLTQIDLSALTELKVVDLSENQLSKVDLSANSQITDLYLYENQITEIDLSTLSAVESLDVEDNRIDRIDISMLSTLEDFWWKDQTDQNNQNKEVTIRLTEDQFYSRIVDFNYYSYPEIVGGEPFPRGNIVFESEEFKQAVIDYHGDMNNDGEVTYQEALAVSYIYMVGVDLKDVPDIKHLKMLESIEITSCHITGIDLSAQKTLRAINLSFNKISSITLPDSPNLASLELHYNKITSLDVSGYPGLNVIQVQGNHLSTLDISMLGELSAEQNGVGDQSSASDDKDQSITVTMTEAQRDLPVLENSVINDRVVINIAN